MEEMPTAPRPTISVTLPAPLVETITRLAHEMGLTRSALISLALTEYVRNTPDMKEHK